MAPLFVAFDRDTYERIAPNHLTDLQQYPQQILSVFESGGSTVSLGGERWHSVTFDEAHEMCINKYLKGAVVRPTKKYLQKTTLFFNIASEHTRIIRQLFPERFFCSIKSNTVLDSTPNAYH